MDNKQPKQEHQTQQPEIKPEETTSSNPTSTPQMESTEVSDEELDQLSGGDKKKVRRNT